MCFLYRWSTLESRIISPNVTFYSSSSNFVTVNIEFSVIIDFFLMNIFYISVYVFLQPARPGDLISEFISRYLFIFRCIWNLSYVHFRIFVWFRDLWFHCAVAFFCYGDTFLCFFMFLAVIDWSLNSRGLCICVI